MLQRYPDYRRMQIVLLVLCAYSSQTMQSERYLTTIGINIGSGHEYKLTIGA